MSQFATAQDIETLVLKSKIPTCQDISQPTSALFAKYIEQDNLDSAQLILQYWKSKCDVSEPLLRAEILVKMLESNPIDSLIDEHYMWYLNNYLNRKDYTEDQKGGYYDSGPYFGFVQPGGSFDKVLEQRFEILEKEFNSSREEFLISRLYSGNTDSIFYEFQKPQYINFRTTKAYNEEVKLIRAMSEWHFGWITGMWIPTGKLTTLGSHPDIGFLAGTKKNEWSYDFIMSFKFLKAKNEYQARRKSANTSETTDHFFGGQMGFEVGRDIISHRNHELQIITGIAMDGIDVLEQDLDLDLDARSIITYNFNLGLGYRIYINGSYYLGLRAKYNIIDYTINDAIDLTGNAFSLQFIIGNLSNGYKKNTLKLLGQKLRQ